MKKFIKLLFTRAGMVKTKPFPESKYIIKEAFEVDGVKYYEMDSIFNIPCLRGLGALKFYEEMNMKCSADFLKAHSAAVKNELRRNPIDIFKIDQLNNMLSERLNFVVETDMVYKLASVVYFDENENPEEYEPEYNQRKIEKWKKAEGVNAFFLRQPIQNLVPFLNGQDIDIQNYSMAVSEITKSHLEIISASLSDEQRKIYMTVLQ